MTFVRPKKSLGQNFLVDDNIARTIVRDMRLTKNDVVVEVGPGHGALTKFLVPNVRKLIAVEIDSRVAGDLEKQFSSPTITILQGDFLDFDVISTAEREGQKLRLAGNIPYYLTSQILVKAFEAHDALQDCTLMVQREVADRLAADVGTKEYGILTVYARFYGTMKKLFDVSPNCFYPKPKVYSSVIRETFAEELPYTVDERLFRTVVRTAFGKRRKTLRNALKYLPFDQDVVVLLRELEASFPFLDKRPEQLTVDDYVELTTIISNHLYSHAEY